MSPMNLDPGRSESDGDGGGPAWAFFVAGALMAAWGFKTMYTYSATANPYSPGVGEIVGGDAYNYIIIGVRGLGWIAAGILCALGGVIYRLGVRSNA